MIYLIPDRVLTWIGAPAMPSQDVQQAIQTTRRAFQQSTESGKNAAKKIMEGTIGAFNEEVKKAKERYKREDYQGPKKMGSVNSMLGAADRFFGSNTFSRAGDQFDSLIGKVKSDRSDEDESSDLDQDNLTHRDATIDRDDDLGPLNPTINSSSTMTTTTSAGAVSKQGLVAESMAAIRSIPNTVKDTVQKATTETAFKAPLNQTIQKSIDHVKANLDSIAVDSSKTAVQRGWETSVEKTKLAGLTAVQAVNNNSAVNFVAGGVTAVAAGVYAPAALAVAGASYGAAKGLSYLGFNKAAVGAVSDAGHLYTSATQSAKVAQSGVNLAANSAGVALNTIGTGVDTARKLMTSLGAQGHDKDGNLILKPEEKFLLWLSSGRNVNTFVKGVGLSSLEYNQSLNQSIMSDWAKLTSSSSRMSKVGTALSLSAKVVGKLPLSIIGASYYAATGVDKLMTLATTHATVGIDFNERYKNSSMYIRLPLKAGGGLVNIGASVVGGISGTLLVGAGLATLPLGGSMLSTAGVNVLKSSANRFTQTLVSDPIAAARDAKNLVVKSKPVQALFSRANKMSEGASSLKKSLGEGLSGRMSTAQTNLKEQTSYIAHTVQKNWNQAKQDQYHKISFTAAGVLHGAAYATLSTPSIILSGANLLAGSTKTVADVEYTNIFVNEFIMGKTLRGIGDIYTQKILQDKSDGKEVALRDRIIQGSAYGLASVTSVAGLSSALINTVTGIADYVVTGKGYEGTRFEHARYLTVTGGLLGLGKVSNYGFNKMIVGPVLETEAGKKAFEKLWGEGSVEQWKNTSDVRTDAFWKNTENAVSLAVKVPVLGVVALGGFIANSWYERAVEDSSFVQGSFKYDDSSDLDK
jgi:hypothetical protein